MIKYILTAASAVFIAVRVIAQTDASSEGATLGPLRVSASASAAMAYDNRIFEAGSIYEEGVYSEVEAGISLRNLPARYNLKGGAAYGYRFNSDRSEIDDDFYSLNASIKTDDDPFKISLSTDYNKSLNYRTDYNPSTGQGPDLVLINEPNLRWISRSDVGYSRALSDKLSVKPEYGFLNYKQQLDDATQTTIAEWQVHSGAVALRYRYTEDTLVALGGRYSMQIRDDETGQISTFYIGSERKISSKVSWNIRLGVSAVDYEESGSEVNGTSNFRMRWKASEKISTYAFAGNQHQPGFSGGSARMVYRAGYGLDWDISSRLSFDGSGLHSYEEDLGSDATADDEDLRHFYTIRLTYRLANDVAFKLRLRYTKDDEDEDRVAAVFNISYTL